MFKLANFIKKSKPVSSIIVAVLIISMVVPFTAVGFASAADNPTPLTLKWTGFVGGGGESLLTYDVLTDAAHPGEEVFHAGGSVAPNSGGRVSCLSGINGTQYWNRTIPNVGDTCQIHMVDIDNDGIMEIVVPLQQPAGVYILNAEDGTTLFSITNLGGGRIDSSPVSGDVDGNGFPDVFIGVMGYETQPSTGKIIRYEWNNNTKSVVERDRVQVWHPCAGGFSLSDTDNDGTFELYMNERDVYFGDGSWGRGTMSFWAENLTVRWQVYGWGASSNIPMLADVNNDGVIDVVTTDLSRSVCVLNSTNGRPLTNNVGTVLSGAGTGERRNHYQSSIYDIDGDGNIEVLSADGFEASYNYVTVWDLWDWQLDAMIDTTAAVIDTEGNSAGGRSWKGPTAGEVTGDGVLDMLVVTFDYIDNSNDGTLQIYSWNDVTDSFDLVHVNTGLRHRAIDAVVQDIDRNDGGLNEVLVLTQGGVIYCFDSLGLSEEAQGRQRARSEVQFYSECRNGASEYIAYERPYPDVSKPWPSNGAVGVSTDLSSLDFTIDHPYGESMDYSVTSSPTIATSNVLDAENGQKSVAITGTLLNNTLYHWTVTVTDDSGHTTVKGYSFTTGPYINNRSPTQTTPSINGSTIKTNLVATAQGTNDLDSDVVTNIYNWQKNGVSITSLNLPFDTMTDPQDEYSGLAVTKDYSYGASASVFGARWVPDGVVGGAYSFDGNDFIRISETSNRFDGGGSRNEMSLECWVKATSITSTETLIVKQNLYNDEDIGQPLSYRLDYRYTGSQLEFTWRVGVGPLGTEGEYTTYVLGPYYVTTGVLDWNHIVCTYKSGEGLLLYVNGVEVSSNLNPSYTGSILNTDGPFEIAFGRGSDFAGLVDEVKLYTYALSPFMVQQRYLDTKDGLSVSNTLSKYELNVGDQWRCQVTPNDGKVDGSSVYTGTLTIADAPNTLPTATDLVITPGSPLTGDDLVANYTYYDADSDPEFGSVVSWYLNGVFNTTGRVLPSDFTTKGDSWTFTVQPSDGFDLGTSVGPSSPVVIGNTAPTFDSVVISPDPAFAGNTLTANSYGFNDPDADAVEGYTYQWQILDGAVWQDIVGATSQTLASANFATNDTVKVIVTVNDGELTGNTVEAETWIVDSASPTLDSATLTSDSGENRDDDSLTCQAVNPQAPEVGESVVSIYNWMRGGTSYANLNMPFETNSKTIATDYSGYGNNGEVYGATWTNEGVVGGAYSFDGNDYIAVEEQSNSLGGDGSWSELSVEFWVKASGSTTSTQTILAKTLSSYVPGGSIASSYSVQYRYYSADRVRIYFNVNNYAANVNVYDQGNLGWHHIVCTYESGVGLNIYADGLLQTTLAVTESENIVASTNGLLYIGGVNSGSGDYSGWMDEVKIYSHVLSAAQVFQNYADANDGLSDAVTIVPQETTNGQTWRCDVTPNDSYQDGTAVQSNQLTITSTNTKPHIDRYTPVTSTPLVYVGSSLDFSVGASDPNNDSLTYKWYLNSTEQAGETSSSWTYSPLSASVCTVKVEVSDGSETVSHEWNVNVEVPEFTLTVNVVGTGDVVITPEQVIYLYGDMVTLNATITDPDWEFVGWSGDVSSSENPLMIEITADTTITATFSNETVLTVDVVGGGHVDFNPAGGAYADGTEVELTPVADQGWSFSGWSGDLTGDNNPETITMDENKQVTATFTQNHYYLTINSDLGGSVIKNPNQGYYTYGDEVQLTAVADLGFLFESWGGDASGYSTVITIVMDDNKTVNPNFELAPEHWWSDGLESGNFSEWTGTTTTTGGSVAVVTSPVNNGEYSGQYAITAGAGTRRAYSYVNTDDWSEAYATAYIYIPSGLSLTDGQALWLIQFADSGGNVLAAYGIRGGASGMQWTVQYNGYPYAMGTAFSGSGWYNLNATFVHASSGPTLTLNVNDVEAASLVYDTSAVNNVATARFGVSYYTGAGAITINIDDATLDSEPQSELYELTISTVGNGQVTRNPDQLYYIEGTEVELTAVADQGWTFSGWSGAATGTDTTTTITIGDGDNTATATFTLNSLPSEGAFDFGASGSPVESGYTQVTGSTLYSVGIGYGWTSIAGLSSRDRTLPNALNRDFVQSGTEHTFNVDLANGDYQVTVTIGDQSFMHDLVDVYAEGVLKVNDVSSVAGSFQQVTFYVTVGDYQLNLRFVDDGGVDPNWVVDALVIQPV